MNALTAADSVLIPVQCEYFALEGLGKLLNTIKIIQTRLNPDLEIEGIVLTMYDSRLRLSNQVVEEVRRHFGDLAFDTIIHRNTRLGEAPSFGKSVIMYDAESKGAINYLNLAREILQKNDSTKMKSAEKLLISTMTNKRPDLGKGIRALLENMDSSVSNEASILGSTTTIPLDQIEVNPFQPRHDFDENAMQELTDSIKVHGIIQPITVRKISTKSTSS